MVMIPWYRAAEAGAREVTDSERVVKVEFYQPQFSAIVTFADGSTAGVTGLLAQKWRDVVQALVRYERDERFSLEIDILDDIREALR